MEVLRQGMSLITTVTTAGPSRQTAWLCFSVTTSYRFMICQICGSGSELIFIVSKSVSVYMHMADVSVSLVTRWTPTGGVD